MNLARPLVSVVIPNYNYVRYLRQCIDSVLAQTYSPIEIVVVDDGSTDESIELLKSYGDKIQVIRQTNGGVSSARNRGIEEARGEYVALLDADDAWDKKKIELQVAALSEDLDAGMVYTGLHLVSADWEPLGERVRGVTGDVLPTILLMKDRGSPGIASSAMVRRECIKKAGAFDVRLSTSADWDFWARIAAISKVLYLPTPLTYCRVHGKGMQHQNPALLERDNLLALSKVFENPAAQRVYYLKRRSYSKLYMVLAGSYFFFGNYRRAAWLAVRSSVLWPPNALYVLGLPLRHLRRAFVKRPDIRV